MCHHSNLGKIPVRIRVVNGLFIATERMLSAQAAAMRLGKKLVDNSRQNALWMMSGFQ
jgi:hypothetical protein